MKVLAHQHEAGVEAAAAQIVDSVRKTGVITALVLSLLSAAVTTTIVRRYENRLAERDKRLLGSAASVPSPCRYFLIPSPGVYKHAGWEALGREPATLLTAAQYDSAKRTTFNAFYTSSTVITAIHEAVAWACPKMPRFWNRGAAPATS